MWDDYNRKYWDISESNRGNAISLADAPMSRIMRAIIICDGKVHDTHCLEKKLNSPELQYAYRYCGIVMRISLPIGAEEEFEKLSKCKLSEPSKIAAS